MPTQEIVSDQISDGTIGSADLADGAVIGSKIASGVVNTVHLAASAVTATIIATGAVTSAKLAVDSVTTAAIADGQVTSIKIVDGAIFASKLATDSVVSSKILDGAVVAGKLGTSAVVAANIGAGAVTNAKLATDSVSTIKIIDGAVNGGKLANGSVTNVHLADGELHFADDTTSLSNKKVILNIEKTGVTLTATLTTDVSLAFSGETAVTSAGTTEGVVTTASKNLVSLRTSDRAYILDGSDREIYGRLTQSSGVWTLSYYVLSPTETATALPSGVTGARLLVPKRFNLNVAPEELFRGTDVFTNNVTGLTEHITLATDAHDASAISIADSGSHFSALNVEDALAAIVGSSWIQGSTDSLYAHIVKTTGAHAATAISFTPSTAPTTDLVSVNVNTAIEELHAEVEALQAAPASSVFGFKSFISSGGQSDFSVSGSTNAPFIVGDDSLMVFRGGVLQSKQASHYTEDPSGLIVHFTTPTIANTNVILKWTK